MQMGEILTELREDKGLTQPELANILGISKSSVSAYELGIRYPTAETLLRYARFFNVSADYLLGIVPVPRPPAFLEKEYVSGTSLSSVLKMLFKLKPDQRSSLLLLLENMSFYAEVMDQANRNGSQTK